MKHQGMELHVCQNPRTLQIVFTSTLALIILVIISLQYPLSGNSTLIFTKLYPSSSPKSPLESPPPSSSSSATLENNNNTDEEEEEEEGESSEKCDIFTGEWVRNEEGPYYTNKTCWAIHEHQNCMKYGRPDSDFLKWRWKPQGCDLPIFNPFQFLEIVRGKSMAFVGDSVARNQMQSLICLLSRVEFPVDVSSTPDEKVKRWRYTRHNFTIATFWTPHLVKSREADSSGPTSTGLFNLYLDQYDEEWTTQIDGFDYLIISAGHWFFRSLVYYEGNRIVGCKYCLLNNVTEMPMYYGYRRAFHTAFKAINSLENYKGITFLRTFAPSHFENGLWNQGGNCVRTAPLKSNETTLEGENLKLYMIQIEEFKVAEREGRMRGKRFRWLDTTKAMLLRPDGHPSKYGHWPYENVTLYNDCVHWCLPGPIDSWSDLLLEMLKMEGIRSHQDQLFATDQTKMRFNN